MIKQIRVIGRPFCIILFFSNAVLGQTPDPITQQLKTEKDQAQLRADIAKAEQDRIQAEAAAFKAQLGTVTSPNLPQGTVKTDSVVIEANYIAYMAARDTAQVISGRIGCPKHLLFYSAKDLDALQAFATLLKQLSQIFIDTKTLFTPVKLRAVATSVLISPGPKGSDDKELYVFEPAVQAEFVPAAAFASIDAALSVISLFKTDTEIKGVATPVDDLALQALIADQLKSNCAQDPITIIHPVYFSAPMESELMKKLKDLAELSVNATTKSQELDSYARTPLVKAIDAANKRNDDIEKAKKNRDVTQKELNTTTGKTKRAELEKQLKDIIATLDLLTKQQEEEMQKAGATTLGQLISLYLSNQLRIEGRITSLKNVASRSSELTTGLTKPDGTGISALQTMLRAESLAKAKGDSAFVLVTKFISLGGNNVTKKNIFHTSLSFTGGSIAEFLFMDSNGLLQQTGVVECYGGRVSENALTKAFSDQKATTVCRTGPVTK